MTFAWWSMWDAYARRYQPGARNATRYLAWNLPLYGDFYRFEQHMKDVNDYFNQYGLDWDDVNNPGRLPGAGDNSGSGVARSLGNSGRNFVSKNITRLYR